MTLEDLLAGWPDLDWEYMQQGLAYAAWAMDDLVLAPRRAAAG